MVFEASAKGLEMRPKGNPFLEKHLEAHWDSLWHYFHMALNTYIYAIKQTNTARKFFPSDWLKKIQLFSLLTSKESWICLMIVLLSIMFVTKRSAGELYRETIKHSHIDDKLRMPIPKQRIWIICFFHCFLAPVAEIHSECLPYLDLQVLHWKPLYIYYDH